MLYRSQNGKTSDEEVVTETEDKTETTEEGT
jgi:hypothetical protein